MRYRVTAYVDSRVVVAEGDLKVQPDGVQVVTLLEEGGTRLVVAGFDLYWTRWPYFGGVNTEDRKGMLRAQTWRVDGGRATVVDPPIVAIPLGADVKAGTLIPDEVARAIGIL